jgi:hypothetical protein
MANAYDDYLQSVASGYSHQWALDHACDCWGVDEADLLAYVELFAFIEE